ncbi:unnamed protein product [Soboliphyme baturini]|uniref:Uncharacterized protein n=1 Tax=Soboliphyme baturini TaxID=241478 RepID=A0A183IFE0_9BILA|nr:unnamed protein product [Soboliphyme baturini]
MRTKSSVYVVESLQAHRSSIHTTQLTDRACTDNTAEKLHVDGDCEVRVLHSQNYDGHYDDEEKENEDGGMLLPKVVEDQRHTVSAMSDPLPVDQCRRGSFDAHLQTRRFVAFDETLIINVAEFHGALHNRRSAHGDRHHVPPRRSRRHRGLESRRGVRHDGQTAGFPIHSTVAVKPISFCRDLKFHPVPRCLNRCLIACRLRLFLLYVYYRARLRKLVNDRLSKRALAPRTFLINEELEKHEGNSRFQILSTRLGVEAASDRENSFRSRMYYDALPSKVHSGRRLLGLFYVLSECTEIPFLTQIRLLNNYASSTRRRDELRYWSRWIEWPGEDRRHDRRYTVGHQAPSGLRILIRVRIGFPPAALCDQRLPAGSPCCVRASAEIGECGVQSAVTAFPQEDVVDENFLYTPCDAHQPHDGSSFMRKPEAVETSE